MIPRVREVRTFSPFPPETPVDGGLGGLPFKLCRQAASLPLGQGERFVIGDVCQGGSRIDWCQSAECVIMPLTI